MPRNQTLETRRQWPLGRLTEWPDFGPFDDMLRFVSGASIRVEEFVEGDDLVVSAELPGIDPRKDVDVSVAGGMLHIRAHREERTEEATKRGYRSEFRYGEFRRTLTLPAETTESDVTARYHDGVLEIRVPLGGKPAHRIVIERA
jgi:HSP20 family protein